MCNMKLKAFRIQSFGQTIYFGEKMSHMQFLNSESSNLGTHSWDTAATNVERDQNKDIASEEGSPHEVRRLSKKEHISARSSGNEIK